jgi:uncharacterized GH25 family protein
MPPQKHEEIITAQVLNKGKAFPKAKIEVIKISNSGAQAATKKVSIIQSLKIQK